MRNSLIPRIVYRNLFLTVLILFCTYLGNASTYYVSSSGKNSNPGTSESLAWKTLSKVNSVSFSAGDQILFRRGDIFYGSLTLNNSGISGNPITFGSYETGSKPVITGFTTVDSWTNMGGNIWESINAVSTLSTCNMVVINGVNTPMGRYPNSDTADEGFLNIDAVSGNTQITCNTLSGTPDWTGAEVAIKVNKWNMEMKQITSQSGSTLNFTKTYGTPRVGYGFFIQKDARTLDQQNEWYYNPTTNKLRIYSTTKPTNIQVPTIDNLILATGRSYITVDGLSLIGANKYAYYNKGTYTDANTIQNCTINFSGFCAISIAYTNNAIIDNNTISNTNGNAVDLRFNCDNAQVNNNVIRNTGMIIGTGEFESSVLTGIYANYQSDNFSAKYNTITNTGYNGLAFSGNNSIAQYNVIDSFCVRLHDGGGIYSWGDFENIIIDHNIITNGIGNNTGTTSSSFPVHGIYIDENGENHNITNNTISKIRGTAIYFHWCNNITTNSNIIYDCQGDDFLQSAIGIDCHAANPTINMITKHNQIVTLEEDAYAVKLNSQDQKESTLLNFGVADSNYYISPFNADVVRILATDNQWSGINRTLNEWQTFSSQDVNSKESPQTISTANDLQFEYNATSVVKSISLSYPMMDVKGTKYNSSVTLQPFTSIILIKRP